MFYSRFFFFNIFSQFTFNTLFMFYCCWFNFFFCFRSDLLEFSSTLYCLLPQSFKLLSSCLLNKSVCCLFLTYFLISKSLSTSVIILQIVSSKPVVYQTQGLSLLFLRLWLFNKFIYYRPLKVLIRLIDLIYIGCLSLSLYFGFIILVSLSTVLHSINLKTFVEFSSVSFYFVTDIPGG